MRVLLSGAAFSRWSALLTAVDPSLEWLVMGDDGTIARPDGAAAPTGDTGVEVAWASSDVFTAGPASPFLRFVEAEPSLRWLQSSAAGTELPLYRALLARGVRVTNAHVQSVAIAEFVLRAVLDEFQNADELRRRQERHEFRRLRFREMAGTTWLVVGMGAIGADVARRAGGFGARVIGVRRHPTGSEPCAAVVPPGDLHAVVPDADVVVLAAPSTPETRHLVDSAFLALMKPDAVLVNVARGALVDEDALLAALERGRVGSAVLDVFATEPLPPDHPFWDHPRVRVSAHTSWNGSGTQRRAAELFVRNLAAFIAGRALENELPAGTTDARVSRP